MSEERNYRYELFQKEVENKALLQQIEELKEFKYDYISSQTIKELKERHMYPSFTWSVCLTLGLYFLLGFLKSIFPSFVDRIFDFLFYFEFFGVGCAFYYFIFWYRTRNIGKR